MTVPRLLALLVAGAVAYTSPDAAEGTSQEAPAGQAEAPSPEGMDQLTARVALYPDALLAQILMCAESPFQVRELGEWLAANPDLQGSAIPEGAEAEGFDPSYIALSAFPQVVQMMAQDLEWTRELGEAFTKDRSAVLESIQRLRTQALAVGSLQSTSQQEVSTQTTESGQEVIVIEPTNPEIVYVPQYDPAVVYITPPPAQTTVVVEDDDEAVGALVGFTAGVFIGAAVNPYYYPYGWGAPAYWYGGGWDDWYDHREDMWDDRQDRREEVEPRREERQTDRGDRQAARQEGGSGRQAARQEGGAGERTSAAARTGAASGALANYGSRGYSMRGTQTAAQRRGTRSSAFSGYGSGSASRAASSRGRASMGRRGGGRRR